MYYNAKQQGLRIERIGMAVSRDMVHWSRYGHAPVIDNGTGISGDPQIVRMGDVWVMFYHFYCAVEYCCAIPAPTDRESTAR
jgi:hypothetical protein